MGMHINATAVFLALKKKENPTKFKCSSLRSRRIESIFGPEKLQQQKRGKTKMVMSVFCAASKKRGAEASFHSVRLPCSLFDMKATWIS